MHDVRESGRPGLKLGHPQHCKMRREGKQGSIAKRWSRRTGSPVEGKTEFRAEAVTVFILAPSKQILEQRLRARGEDRDDVVERRLKEAAEEIRNYGAYDYVLINRDLEASSAVLIAIVRAERVRRTRIEADIQPILETFQV